MLVLIKKKKKKSQWRIQIFKERQRRIGTREAEITVCHRPRQGIENKQKFSTKKLHIEEKEKT